MRAHGLNRNKYVDTFHQGNFGPSDDVLSISRADMKPGGALPLVCEIGICTRV